MTREYLMRLLRKEDRDSRNKMRREGYIFERGYYLGRAHASSELLKRLQCEPRRKAK